MEKPPFHQAGRRPGRNHPQFGPVLVIFALLACWLVIAEWPELTSSVLSLANY